LGLHGSLTLRLRSFLNFYSFARILPSVHLSSIRQRNKVVFLGILSPPVNGKWKCTQSIDDSPSYFSAKEWKLKLQISLEKNLCSLRAENEAFATLWVLSNLGNHPCLY